MGKFGVKMLKLTLYKCWTTMVEVMMMRERGRKKPRLKRKML